MCKSMEKQFMKIKKRKSKWQVYLPIPLVHLVNVYTVIKLSRLLFSCYERPMSVGQDVHLARHFECQAC
jgi:hypothetical protein